VPSATGEHIGPSDPLVCSVKEAADLLGIGRTLLYKLLATGEIDSFKIGGKRKVPRDAIDGYIERLRSQPAAVPASDTP
jgi:excisionase family DNA binding protein